jgi:hypothetical protein
MSFGVPEELICQSCKVAEADVQVVQNVIFLTERAREKFSNVHGLSKRLLFCIECAGVVEAIEGRERGQVSQ